MIAPTQCVCIPGYEGPECQTEIDECLPEPCQNGATCLDLIAEYQCECVPGYNDVNCSTNIDECEVRICEIYF